MSRQVTFQVTEPSGSEYLEEYSKITKINQWYLLVFLLTSSVSFCTSVQLSPFEYKGINYLYDQLVTRSIGNETKLFYKSKCRPRRDYLHLGNISNNTCEKEALAIEVSICKGIGTAVGSAIGGVLADIYGRRTTGLIFGTLWTLMSCSFVFVRSRLALFGCCIVITGLLRVTHITTFIRFAEIANRKTRILCIYTMITENVGDFVMVYAAARLEDWTKLTAFIVSIIPLMLFACWYVPESPRWLLNNDNKTAAFAQLEELTGLRYNFGDFFGDTDDDESEHTKSKMCSAMIVFLIQKRLKNFLIFCLLMVISSLFFVSGKWKTVINFIYTGQLGTLSFTIEAASYLFMTPIYIFLGKRFGLFLIYLLLTIGSLITLLTASTATKGIYFSVFKILVGQSTTNLLSAYVLDVFPTFIRATVFGLLNAVEGLVIIGAVLLMDRVENFNQLHYNLILLVVSLFGSLVLVLPVTSKQDLPNFKLHY